VPTFATPGPISLRVDLPFGDTRIIASDRDTTVVDVLGDADAIRVGCTGDEVTVTAAGSGSDRGLLGWGLGLLGIGPDTDVTVTVELPAGSRVQAGTRYGSVSAEGRLDTCRVTTAYGEVRLGETGRLEVRGGHGDISVEHVAGDAEITTASGDVRVGVVEGAATITDKHSDIAVAEAMGPLHLRGTHGEVSVGRVFDGMVARNAYGGVHVDELVAGACDVATTYGEVEIGIAEGTAAWLDVGSDTGTVHTRLDEQPGPEAFDRTCEIHARTRDGDIVVRRARRLPVT
jgi:Toastrack DUF4097